MPLYDYDCLNCSHVFNALAKHDDQLTCPNCGSEAKRKFPHGSNVSIVWAQGKGLSDVHDIEIARMQDNGELMPT